MYAVEFEAPIENGIVHIPQQYRELQHSAKARFVVMYNDSANNTIKNDDEVQSQLAEFRRLRSQSNNKITATMDLVINTDAQMIDDGIF
ncbi:MAG: hypothetical protein JJV88_00960 [Sulfurovum sp.]|nr:hypothetical protein [Sulfurovaceae bacterium]